MRYKGLKSEQTLARDFPHCVGIVVPLGGFGKRLDVMHDFLRGMAYNRGHGRRDGERDVTRWLLAHSEDAQAFAQGFGGVVIE
jgi:hypothetical protein